MTMQWKRWSHLSSKQTLRIKSDQKKSEEEVEEDALGVKGLCLKVCQQYLESKQEERLVQGQVQRYGNSQ
jgi:hypothetical protein